MLFSCTVLSNSLQTHGLKHCRPPCPISESLPKFMSIASVMSSSHLSLWCPLLLSSNFPSIRKEQNQLFTSSDQNTGTSASASVLPMSIQGWYPLRLSGLISLQSKGLSGVFTTTVWRHSFFGTLHSLWSNSQPYMTTGKTIALTIWTFVSRVMSLLFNILS